MREYKALIDAIRILDDAHTAIGREDNWLTTPHMIMVVDAKLALRDEASRLLKSE